jgi:hypothetical protein
MKENEKGFRNSFRKFRTSAKYVPCSTKLPLYWQLVEECLEKDEESVEFVRERWGQFRMIRIMNLEKKLGTQIR